VSEFKVLLYSLTNVPLEKQKVIFKGQVFQNEKVLSDYKITENAAISLIGNPESNQTLIQPKQQIVFIEDMTKEQKAQFMKQKAGILVPAGLKNLGNTCYLNSTI
jgi:ubiquitin carboxyl-terminal hydrolase 14